MGDVQISLVTHSNNKKALFYLKNIIMNVNVYSFNNMEFY